MDYVAQEISIVDRNSSPGKEKRGGASAKENAMKGATERISRFKGGWPAVMVKVDEKMGLGLLF